VSFSHAAPTAWHVLPPTVTSQSTFSSFKQALKTYLYQLAHDTQSGSLAPLNLTRGIMALYKCVYLLTYYVDDVVQ